MVAVWADRGRARADRPSVSPRDFAAQDDARRRAGSRGRWPGPAV